MVRVMRVLVVDSYDPSDPNRNVVTAAVQVLEDGGNTVHHLSISGQEFDHYLSADERRAYETDEPLRTPETRAAADAFRHADAVLFAYPMVLFGAPPRLKAFLERVMVPGVAFVFNRRQKVRPGLTNIKRIGVITTSAASRREIWHARDLGYRLFMRTLRLNCHRLCRRTFVRIPDGAPTGRTDDQLKRSLRAWR